MKFFCILVGGWEEGGTADKAKASGEPLGAVQFEEPKEHKNELSVQRGGSLQVDAPYPIVVVVFLD